MTNSNPQLELIHDGRHVPYHLPKYMHMLHLSNIPKVMNSITNSNSQCEFIVMYPHDAIWRID